MAKRHTLPELYQYQALSLNVKIAMTRDRVREWIETYGEDGVYISFSGGKDSTVLLDLVRNRFGYKNVPAVFFDVPTQFPELRQFAEKFENVEIVKPKISFMEVFERYGFPMLSKEISECVQGARKYMNSIIDEQGEQIVVKKRSEQKCAYCDNLLGKKGCLGMCNKHYIQYKRWGDPLHADKKARSTIDGYFRDGKTGRREHRVIWENYYGEKLSSEEVIHHINFVKTDNRIENLYKYPNASEHIKAHREFERLEETLKESEDIVFEDGRYIKRERERDSVRQTKHPYRYWYERVCGQGKYAKSEWGGYDNKYRKLHGLGEYSKRTDADTGRRLKSETSNNARNANKESGDIFKTDRSKRYNCSDGKRKQIEDAKVVARWMQWV